MNMECYRCGAAVPSMQYWVTVSNKYVQYKALVCHDCYRMYRGSLNMVLIGRTPKVVDRCR